jgi:isopentenyl-diphosphate delta-isomerase
MDKRGVEVQPMEELSFQAADAEQRAMMEEMCVQVDDNDNVIGPVSKKISHLNSKIREGLLHRAFSVFLFDSQGRLLLQQRSSKKITYNLQWTNTCCSHPVFFVDGNNTESGRGIPDPEWELERNDNLGIKRAAQRKLWHELGIPAAKIPLENFHYLTRIHYISTSASEDGVWGEHEIDYILFVRADTPIEPRPTEVADYRYVTQDELRALIAQADQSSSPALAKDKIVLTPWFRLIAGSHLFKWWDAFVAGKIHEHYDHDTIHRMLE